MVHKEVSRREFENYNRYIQFTWPESLGFSFLWNVSTKGWFIFYTLLSLKNYVSQMRNLISFVSLNLGTQKFISETIVQESGGNAALNMNYFVFFKTNNMDSTQNNDHHILQTLCR